MGDYGGSNNHVAAGAPGYVGNDKHEDWSWMRNTRTNDNAGYSAEEGEHHNDVRDGGNYEAEDNGANYEAEYNGANYEVEYNGANYEAEYNGANYEAEYNGANYEAEYSYTQVEGATTSSGYGHRRVRSASGDHTGFLHSEGTSSESSEEDKPAKEKTKKKKKKNKNLQLERVREPADTHSDPGYDDGTSSEYARSHSIDLVSSWLRDASLGDSAPRAPPSRLPPPRRHLPGADMATRSASPPNQNAAVHDEAYNEENQIVLYNPAPRSNVYRLEEKPLDRALNLVRTRAAEFASVSRTAAENIRQRSIEFTTSTVIPIMRPLLNAVVEESKQHLNGIFDPPGRPNSPYGPAPGRRGRGRRGGPVPRPMYGRPPMMRGMPPGPRPVMRPGPPGMMPRPTMIRPGMRPPPPGAMAARGQGAVAVRGQPRPRGRARPVAPPDPTW